MSTGELINQVQSNIRFRVTSARDMVMGITGESEMSPLQRRREIRNRRMSLVGMGESSDDSSSSKPSNPTSSSGSISTSGTTHGGRGTENVSDSIPSMSEVDEGTKARADNSGFSEVN
jgi:hypothetical protein